VGAGAATFTPLSQIIFFPDLTHVNLVWATVEVMPIEGQGAPAFAAATAGETGSRNAESAIAISGAMRFMSET
jgi:hypothetical protein